MEKQIRIIDNNNTSLTIIWDINNNTNKHIVIGLNNLHNWEEITRTDKNILTIKKEDLKSFIELKIQYIIEDKKDIIIDTTSSLKLNNSTFEELPVRIINSYNGITISYASNTQYDKYYLYEKNNDTYNLILETEDFQITSNIIKKDKYYYIEGLTKENDNYVLRAKSNEFLCVPETLSFTKKIDLSVVVPIYNAEIFLSRCLDSILLSTFNSFELILINDGSTDNSKKILDWYEKEYKDVIKVIHKENEGVTYSRNKGIEIATGEYIAFVDNDDLIHPKMYELLYKYAKENDSDIAIGKTLIRNDKYNYYYCLNIPKAKDCLVYSYDKMVEEEIRQSYDNIFFVAIWNKIIKTSLVKEHKFPLHNYYEDTAFTRNIYSYIDKFVFVPNALYVWDKRFQNTIGTASNHYEKDNDPMFVHKAYIFSVCYGVDEGNKDKMESLVYTCTKDLVSYLKTIEKSTSIEAINLYKDKIRELNNKSSFSNNKYFNNDKELYTYIKNLL